jgi:hypothetical protein
MMEFNHQNLLEKTREEVIPDRLWYVNTITLAYLLKFLYEENEDPEVSYFINRKKRLSSPLSYLTEPIMVTGIINARSLLQFLGINYNRQKDNLYIKPTKVNDIDITDFGLSYVTIDELSEEEIKVYKAVMYYANVSIAHITQRSYIKILPKYVYKVGMFLPELFIRCFYSKLPFPIPNLQSYEFEKVKN